MSPEDFKAGRLQLGLSRRQLAVILGVVPQTITKWEAPPSASTSTRPNLGAAQVLRWMLEGWRPPEWPTEPAAGKRGRPQRPK